MRPADVTTDARGHPREASPAVLTAAGWVVGVLVTALILGTPYFTFGHRSPAVHLVLNTLDACVALLLAYLLHGRFVRRGRLQDLLLAQGLVLLAVAGSGLTFAVEALSGSQDGTVDVWLPLSIRVAAAATIMVAAFADSIPAQRQWRRWSALGPVTLVLLVSALLWLGRTVLPVALDPASAPPSAQRPLLVGHPVLLIAQAVTALCFLVASIVFARQAVRRKDDVLRWLGPACALSGFARLSYLLFPSLYTDWIYTGDVLRTGSYLLLLIGATREIQQYWRTQADSAVTEDRRRLARELHDGVIQELAYIRSQSYSLPKDHPARSDIMAACDRGLDEARAAVQTLGRAPDEPLGFVLHRAAAELADRYAIALDVEVDDSIHVAPSQQHALMRITREAVSNAVRHGKATRVAVRLGCDPDGRCRLTVADDGSGFDVAAVRASAHGYGLTSMRDRARALPGSLSLDATCGQGSVVTVER